MKRFRERNLRWLGIISLTVIVVLVVGALEFTKLPLINHNTTYEADFANSGGLDKGDAVALAGVNLGQITGLSLDGTFVKVRFTIKSSVKLPADTGASAQVLSPIGTEYLQLLPVGGGRLHGVIPLSRTTVPFTIVDTLSQLSNDTSAYNIANLEKALDVGSQDLAGTPASVTASALVGLEHFSQILASRQSDLRAIVTQGSQLASVLSGHSNQLVALLGQGDLLLQVLQQRRAAIQQLLTGTASLSQQVTEILGGNQSQLQSLLSSFQTVTGVLAADSASIGQALPVLAALSRYTANSTGSGPFVDAVVPTLLIPDTLIDACGVSSAFPSTNPEVGCRP